MRRAEREITDPAKILAFLEQEQILRVGFFDGGEIYIVPVNYGISQQDGKTAFYFHGALAGRKYELAKACPKVGFEIDGNYRLLEHELACKYSAAFQSVIGTGTLRLVEDEEEKRFGLSCVMKQTTGKAAWQFPDEAVNRVAVFRLDAEKMTFKAK